MLAEDSLEINANVVDAVGELANMVAGSAKAHLEQYQLSISIPTVITGSDRNRRCLRRFETTAWLSPWNT